MAAVIFGVAFSFEACVLFAFGAVAFGLGEGARACGVAFGVEADREISGVVVFGLLRSEGRGDRCGDCERGRRGGAAGEAERFERGVDRYAEGDAIDGASADLPADEREEGGRLR